jgi:Tol biopolymer transport system component
MDPSWHPAGDRLAWTYAPSDAGGRRDVYLMSMTGKTFGSSVPVTRTRTVDERQPTFSPDGTTIAYTRGSLSSPEVWLVGADGRNARRVLTSAYDPAWSPDGRKLAFARNREIYTVDVTGRNLRRITNDTDTDGDASWSPDGRRLVWASGAGSSRGSYLWTGSAAGGAPRQVTFELEGEGYEDRNDDVTPAWSPDGTSIAFSRWNLMGGELWTTRADGTGATLVAHLCLDPDWQRLP